MSAPSQPLLGRLPEFRPPRTMPEDDPLPEDENDRAAPAASRPPASEPEPDSSLRRSGRLRGLLTPKPDRDATRTDTSSVGSKPTIEETAGLIGGLLVLTLSGAAWWVRKRGRLRMPTDQQERRIAEPLARIALRFVSAGVLNPTLSDAIRAGAAAGAYINDGPLIDPAGAADAGVPARLNDDPEREIL